MMLKKYEIYYKLPEEIRQIIGVEIKIGRWWRELAPVREFYPMGVIPGQPVQYQIKSEFQRKDYRLILLVNPTPKRDYKIRLRALVEQEF